MAKRIVLDDVKEKSTGTFRLTVQDDGASSGTAISSANISVATISLLLKSDGTTVNSVSDVDVSSEITTGGLLTHIFTTTDNALQSTADSMPETRIISFHWVGVSSESNTITKNEEFEYDVVQSYRR